MSMKLLCMTLQSIGELSENCSQHRRNSAFHCSVGDQFRCWELHGHFRYATTHSRNLIGFAQKSRTLMGLFYWPHNSGRHICNHGTKISMGISFPRWETHVGVFSQWYGYSLAHCCIRMYTSTFSIVGAVLPFFTTKLFTTIYGNACF